MKRIGVWRVLVTVAVVVAGLLGAVPASQGATGGGISGRVTDRHGMALVGARIQVPTSTGIAEALTGADGTYLIEGLDDNGGYQVRVLGPAVGQKYVPFDYPTDVGVWDGQITTGIDAALQAATLISGRVTDELGAPVDGATVKLYREEGTLWPSVDYEETGPDGGYSFLLRDAGTYRLEISATERARVFYPRAALIEDADDVEVAEGEHRFLPDVATAPASHVTGFVTGEAYSRWREPAVTAPDVILLRRDHTMQWRTWGGAHVEADGSYDVSEVPAGQYRVQFEADRDTDHVGEYFDDAADLEHARDLDVATGGTVAHVDATLRALGTIRGHVVDAAGRPAEGIQVALNSYLGDFYGGHLFATTDHKGIYRFHGLTGGLYRVAFALQTTPGHPARYRPQFWPNARSESGAVDITMHRFQHVGGVDAVLTKTEDRSGGRRSEKAATRRAPGRGAVVGALHNVLGEPVYGPKVIAWRQAGGSWERVATVRSMNSLVHGPSYFFPDLAVGRYRFEVIDDVRGLWAPEFTGGARHIEGATDVVLTDETIADAGDIRLDPVVRFARPFVVGGRARVGSRLRVGAGLVSPTDARIAVQWCSEGRRIRGATERTYVLRGRDVGHRITARIRGTRPAFGGATTTTPRTGRVRR